MPEEVAVRNADPDALIVQQAAQFEDPELIAKAIMQRILDAETPEEVLTQQGTVGARDVLGMPLDLTDVRFMKSGYEEGAGAYALLSMVNADGEELVVTCGGRNVLAQVFRLHQLGALPRRVRFAEAGQTAAGFKPLWLQPA